MALDLSPTVAHLIAGLAGVGALSGLAATGTIPGGDAFGAITGIIGVLIGSSAVAVGAAGATTTTITEAPRIPGG